MLKPSRIIYLTVNLIFLSLSPVTAVEEIVFQDVDSNDSFAPDLIYDKPFIDIEEIGILIHQDQMIHIRMRLKGPITSTMMDYRSYVHSHYRVEKDLEVSWALELRDLDSDYWYSIVLRWNAPQYPDQFRLYITRSKSRLYEVIFFKLDVETLYDCDYPSTLGHDRWGLYANTSVLPISRARTFLGETHCLWIEKGSNNNSIPHEFHDICPTANPAEWDRQSIVEIPEFPSLLFPILILSVFHAAILLRTREGSDQPG